MAFLSEQVICGSKIYHIENATLYHFGMLNSTMHMAWTRAVCGRMKSDYSYSNTIVYNNYPWPNNITDKHRSAIATAAQGILHARAAFPTASLADLYDPITMPPVLTKAHRALDRAVDAAYGYASKATGSQANEDAPRVAFLFTLYQQMTAGTAMVEGVAVKKKRKTKVAI